MQNSQPSSLVRAMQYARVMTSKALMLGGAVWIAEAILPEAIKPSSMLGGFVGSVEVADIKTKQEAVVEFARQQAEAASIPPAQAQMETDVFRTQQQVLAESMGVQTGAAQIADFACIVGSLIPGNDPDFGDFGKAMKGACGAGDALRKNIVDDLATGGRDGSAIIDRGRP